MDICNPCKLDNCSTKVYGVAMLVLQWFLTKEGVAELVAEGVVEGLSEGVKVVVTDSEGVDVGVEDLVNVAVCVTLGDRVGEGEALVVSDGVAVTVSHRHLHLILFNYCWWYGDRDCALVHCSVML
jgi:hypothetical protein